MMDKKLNLDTAPDKAGSAIGKVEKLAEDGIKNAGTPCTHGHTPKCTKQTCGIWGIHCVEGVPTPGKCSKGHTPNCSPSKCVLHSSPRCVDGVIK